MDSDQDLSECPLCLEVLEADDLNFFPCTCCYQICRFCWHRIRTDENGLCPACRKPYSENPAQFKPLTEEEIQQNKRERKFKESNKKPKTTESRKHLTNLRVVQQNLVFVNGLPSRLADTELLRRNDHFGKYGKIVKLVTSPAHNGQLNSICVYITYSRSEEALRAIQALCNYQVDGRTLKATLGTTKYCSRYLKGAVCQKTDCLYLHEPGDPSASFTKEQMQQGLHLDYERKLMEQYANQSASGTPKASRSTANGQKIDSSQKRPMPLLSSNSETNFSLPNPVNGHSDFESGDENNPSAGTSNHHFFNGYANETFPNATVINGDSDSSSSSSSSQTSSEHDPSSSSRTQIPTYQVSPTSTTWPEQKSPSNPLASNNTVRTNDPLPEYKLFATNTPSIHTLFFGTNDHTQPKHQSHSALSTGIDDLEARLSDADLINGNSKPFLQTQESDELGFDPCSLFMSALAPDIEDERRPSSLNSNMTNGSLSLTSSSWMMPSQMQSYPEATTTPQKQQRYPFPFNGSSPKQMWNGNVPSAVYPTRLDFNNQIQHTSQYPPLINHPYTNTNTVPTDRWMNMSPQWSNTASNNLINTSRWSQSPSQSHMFTNGMYIPYANPSIIDDGSRP